MVAEVLVRVVTVACVADNVPRYAEANDSELPLTVLMVAEVLVRVVTVADVTVNDPRAAVAKDIDPPAKYVTLPVVTTTEGADNVPTEKLVKDPYNPEIVDPWRGGTTDTLVPSY